MIVRLEAGKSRLDLRQFYVNSMNKILLVDDDPIMREIAGSHLSDAGYAVITAENGAEAVEILNKGGISLVISDLDMPIMNGFALTENIRRSENYSATPVIVITASDHGDAVDRAFAAGATSFLSKPINWSLFTHAVKFVIRAAANETALRVAKDQAEAGARFKDSLMSIMSHELRTPLNAIIGFGQLLGDQFNRENDHLHKEYADYVVDGGKRLLESVSDMLLASDARSGPIMINDVDSTLEDIIELAVSSKKKSIELASATVTRAIHNPNLEIRCDNQLLSRAIAKLIDNSIKFSDRGVKIVVGTAEMENGSIAILIKDNGPGVNAEKLQTAIQPFAQSDMSLRRSKEGLGLGLPLVGAIASAHDADFKVSSEPQKGLQACIILPRKRITSTKAYKKSA